ncbi:MAG: oxygen-independent coproporphyrinogen III oxidase [Flavobacteriaceae bacterium]|nr:oxygen-independent coproporphyrinogen III oxidase [Flavobacteriaceae bacterium]
MKTLVEKYNIAGPRYTSYPTVPMWNTDAFSLKRWKVEFKAAYDKNKHKGLSLYLHLPFCESLCTFCGCNKRITKNHSVETTYIKALLKEWALYLDLIKERPLIKEIHLGGGTPTFFSPENLEYLIRSLLTGVGVADDYNFSFEAHPMSTTEAHLRSLYNLGFDRLSFGIQDYSPKVQKAIHRVQPFERVESIHHLAKNIGYTSVGHDIIYGLPFQTKEDIAYTIACTNQLKPDRIAFYSYAHTPWLKGNGQRGFSDADLPSAEAKLAMYLQGKDGLKSTGYIEVGMDHFALPSDALLRSMFQGKLHRNFMGYTEQDTEVLIGLGVSAIGDCKHAFAQNLKSVEAYQASVMNHQFPIFRGHHLNKREQLLSGLIQDIMCKFETQIPEDEFSDEEMQFISDNLTPLINDKLIEIKALSLKVTDIGMQFLRNIAMAFDLSLMNFSHQKPMFSI